MKTFISMLAAIIVGALIIGSAAARAKKWDASASELAGKIELTIARTQWGDPKLELLSMRALKAQRDLSRLLLRNPPLFTAPESLVKSVEKADWYISDYLKQNPNADLDKLPEPRP